jgi:Mitochondrial carrier protein
MGSPLSPVGGFAAGALAACGAVTATNPMEVVKTRLQLQGELAAKGQVKKVYTGVFQALRKIAVNEGIRGTHSPHLVYSRLTRSGTQRGLGVAV